MTDEEREKRMAMARQFMQELPHARALNMQITKMTGGQATVAMGYDSRLIGDPDTGVIHGGAVSALMDTCAGAAVLSHPSVADHTATLGLRIDYMRPAKPGDAITATAECYHVTRSVAFVRATAVDGDPSRPVATATGTFTIGTGGKT